MGHKCALLEIVGHRRRTDAGEPFIHISAKRGYMLENPMHPLCRKVRGGDDQQETGAVSSL